MSIDPGTVRTLFAAELRTVLRDRRTIVMSVVLPLAVMPLMLSAGRWSERRHERRLEATAITYAVTGSQASAARAFLDRAVARGAGERAKEEKGPALTFREKPAADPAASLEKGELHFYVEAATAEEEAARRREHPEPADEDERAPARRGERARPGEDGGQPLPGVPVFTLVYRADRDASSTAVHRMRQLLRETRREQRGVVLRERGLPVAAQEVARVVTDDVATAGQVTGLQIGRLLTVFLLLFVLTGGAVVATDSLAGEKERGTLETLLTTAASRAEIVTAKQLLIFCVAVLITLIQVANLLVYVGFNVIPLPSDFAAALPPSLALLLLVLYLPVVALVASVLLLVSGHAKSYKEAQLNFFPVMLLGLVPALAPFLPGVPLRSVIVLVPVANIAVAVKEILVGVRDWPLVAVAWLVTAGAAAWVSRLTTRALSTERLITASDRDAGELAGGAALFPRHVVRAFALMWAIILLVNFNLGEQTDLRVQLVFNLVVVFLGGSLLLIRKYRLDPREVLALRPVAPPVWLAVLIGAPGALLTGTGIFRLANHVIPVPPEVLDSFSQAFFPENLPVWAAVAMLSITPGICEEIAFRGVLLHGLSRRMRPPAVALAVGLAFGLFHFSLFRIPATAFLGVLWSAVVMLTGSIFPVMLWHALNNVLGLLAGHHAMDMSSLPTGTYLLGVAALAISFWILWRVRTPYPGLRWKRGDRRQGTGSS